MSEKSMSEKQDCEIIIEYYRTLREHFITQGNRMWTRFNYFLTIETAIIGIYLTKTTIISVSWPGNGIIFLGIFWTILWFIIGAQDLWFYKQYQKRREEFEKKYIGHNLEGWDIIENHYNVPCVKTLVCFKIPKCGVATFASLCPLLLLIGWIFIWVF